MKSYRILMHDDRGAAPVELVAEMARDERVVEFCRDRLAVSPRVASIEIWSNDGKLCHLWSETRRAA
jgi:hypothetical protein